MLDEKLCSDCTQNHDCKTAYRQLGASSGPSVVMKALVAFLLPIVVFIIALAVFENVLAGVFSNETVQTVFISLLAAGVSFVCILVTKMINNRLTKKEDYCALKGEIGSKQKAD